MLKTMAVAVVMLAGCGPAPLPGSPKLGSACDSATDARECYTEASIAFCDGSTWAEYPCEDRCSNAQSPKCTLQRPKAGDACPSSWENAGMCAAADTFARCVSGKWVTCSCLSCSISPVLQCTNRVEC